MDSASRRKPVFLAVLVFSGLTVAGCGAGSGGFRPPVPTHEQSMELELLDEVSPSAGCSSFESGGPVCGFGATAVLEGTTPPLEVTVELNSGERTTVTCLAVEDGRRCVFQVVIDTAGFPDGTSFFATFLVREPFSGSYTAEPRPLDALQKPGQYGGSVKVDLPDGDEAKIVLGILSYVPPDEADPRLIRHSQELLDDYRSTVVFATSDLTVFWDG